MDDKLRGLIIIVDSIIRFILGLYIKGKILYLDFENNCYLVMKLYVEGDLI